MNYNAYHSTNNFREFVMSKRSLFQLNVTYLEDMISSFCDEILSLDDIFCYVSEVETLHKSDEEQAPDQISAYPINSGKLKSKNLLYIIFGSFYVDGQRTASTKITKKYPGVLVLPKNSMKSILAKIEKINHLKKECADAFKNLANNHEDRFKIAHEIFPMLISFQVFREIPSIETEGSINSIKFYWRETMITKKYSKQQILDYLYNKKAFVADRTKIFNKNLDVWADVDAHIETVSNQKDNSTFRMKRHSSIPTPSANISILNEGKLTRLNKRASLPYLIFDHPTEISLLTDYELEENKNSNRINKSNYINLIPIINLELQSNV